MAPRQDGNTPELVGRDLPLRTKPAEGDYKELLRNRSLEGTCIHLAGMFLWSVHEGGSILVH